ncbi:hypothetical protein [Saccharothrix sp.]|uniref:hypothetical protein n=1 Tax=Saccharothrix sp. TaxID=1873460 RepID=UPI0028117161|nr:hypothetical protein [Saccharothrix sp.]
MKRTRTISALIAIMLMSFAPMSASADTGKGDHGGVGALSSCIWDNVVTWDAGSQDNGTPYRIPGGLGDDPGYADTTATWYITTNKCADINIALRSRPQPAQTIGVRACYASGHCDSWKFWGPGFSGWLELNDQQPSIGDNVWFYVEMYSVDPYTTGWIGA